MANKPVLVKKVKGGNVYQSFIFMLKGVRLSYAHLDKPYAGESTDGGQSDPKYGVVCIMHKKTHAEIKEALVAAFGQLKAENKNAKVAKDKLCLRDGDDQDKEEYEGAWTLSAREVKRPKCRDMDGEILQSPSEIAEALYSGCYADVVIRLWFQDNKYGKRINANLASVKKVRDGEPFGEGAIDDDDLYEDDDTGGFDGDDDDGDI